MLVAHRLEATGAVSFTAATIGWVATVGSAVQLVSGIIGIISGIVYLISWYKSRNTK